LDAIGAALAATTNAANASPESNHAAVQAAINAGKADEQLAAIKLGNGDKAAANDNPPAATHRAVLVNAIVVKLQ
jgi:hypothetical protein